MVIGITGSIGAGKSSVSNIFRDRGFYVIDCDEVSHKIDDLKIYKNKLKKSFGSEVFTNDKVDRKKLANLAFSSKENVKKLENISYPVILNEINKQKNKAIKMNMVCVYDAPTLFESGLNKDCNITIGVISKKDLRIERALKRGTLSKEDILNRIAIQPNDKFYIDNCTYIIENNGTFDNLEKEVDKLIKNIRGDN